MAKIDRFLFLVPNSRWFGKRCWMWFVPAVPLLVPILRQCGVAVEVLEANIEDLSQDEVQARIRAFEPNAVGISNMSLEYWRQAHACAALARAAAPDAVTIMGGVHPTSLPNRVLEDENIDYVVLAEGEERLPALLERLGQGQREPFDLDGVGWRGPNGPVIRAPRRWIDDLDAFPLPDYTAFDWRKVMQARQAGAAGGMCTKRTPVGALSTSRGCPFHCCFCAGWLTMGRRVRFRSPAHVLREIDMLVQDYGVREIVFQDDEMYADRGRAVAIIEGIKARGYDLIWKNSNLAAWRMDWDLIKLMKASGCYQITISPESGSARVLRELIHKPGSKQAAREVARWCKELDLELEADFVIGFPGETWEEIRETTAFAEELDADAVKFAVATPFPGTELFRMAVDGGYLAADFDFYRDDALGFANPVIETECFTAQELRMLRCMEWDRINFKTREKADRYRRVNPMSRAELAAFRQETRRNLGVYVMDNTAGPADDGGGAGPGG